MLRVISLREASKYMLIALGLHFACLLLHITGFSAPYWIYVSGQIETNIGLWRGCFMGFCRNNGNATGWVNTVQGLETTALVTLVGSIVCLLGYKVKSNKILIKLSMAATTITGVLIMAGVINYAANSVYDGVDLGWAFYIEILASLITIPAVCVLPFELRYVDYVEL
ncbi:hypothetical protein SNE40_021940 [Patella caerulea]|uniref:Uncharacterized protein n=1 Tax=Patella caerulea TaxID=87958 RepID=A0AAN8IZI1_PATCE